MEILNVFALGFVFSFLGSLPPSVVNVSIIQLGTSGNLRGALNFGCAAALVEVVYSFIAIKFQLFILTHDSLKIYLHLISALALLVLGIVNLIAKKKEVKRESKGGKGFVRGIFICLLNPFLIPFWVVTTAYLVSNNWLILNDGIKVFYYICGISIGAWVLHIILAFLAARFSNFSLNKSYFNKAIGVVFTLLGIYSLINLIIII